MTSESHSTPFSSLDDYIALPRVEGLTLSPDGVRVVDPEEYLQSVSQCRPSLR
ncbi:hypothetical protein [Cryobacterium sp. Y29]|uniref:hypothetical protein n=1 Tax=Cryobacterium sp. Y29 TaxID=2048285 RepID=UPI001304CB80|nr:hypothetical protein [Cryobacterium sp. Y29]